MKPLLLHYYVTMRCNARCSFCDIWREEAGLDATLNDVSINLLHARQAGCRFVDFTGGEPLLNKHLPQFLQHARRLGFITSVTTNCLLFPERAKELTGLVDLLHFSLNADTAGLHDAIRGRRSFDHVLESIDLALQNRLVPDLLFTYTDENISALEGVIRLGREKKLLVILDPLFVIDGNNFVSPQTHAQAIDYSREKGVYLNRSLITLRTMGGNHTASPLCRAVNATIVILPDNRLALPCFHHRRDFLHLNGDLDKVLHSPVRADAAGMQGRYSFCEGCHINCYFDPSFNYMRNRLFVQSMVSKLIYAWRKYVVYHRPWPKC
jgi:MoaA/NifB/PqqE/SkfB family radical SAM enzyme